MPDFWHLQETQCAAIPHTATAVKSIPLYRNTIQQAKFLTEELKTANVKMKRSLVQY